METAWFLESGNCGWISVWKVGLWGQKRENNPLATSLPQFLLYTWMWKRGKLGRVINFHLEPNNSTVILSISLGVKCYQIWGTMCLGWVFISYTGIRSDLISQKKILFFAIYSFLFLLQKDNGNPQVVSK